MSLKKWIQKRIRGERKIGRVTASPRLQALTRGLQMGIPIKETERMLDAQKGGKK